MLKVGLVGVGGISGAHIPAWNAMAEVELVAVCDIRPERMDTCPNQRHYTDFDEMLAAEDLDILDICLPTNLHVDYAVKAMEKGIHVLCEKPISLDPAQVERAYSTAQENHVKFMIAQVLRFWPEYELLLEICRSQRFGKLLSGYMSRLGQKPKWSWDNWMLAASRSGLVPYDLHVHDVDFMVYAFGTPKNVHRNRVKTDEQDYLAGVYEYPDFFITAEASWYAAPLPFAAGYRFQFEEALVTYSGGVCTIYHNDGSVLNLSAGEGLDTGNINLPQSDAYANEIRYFANCVLDDKMPDKIKAEELIAVINILNGF